MKVKYIGQSFGFDGLTEGKIYTVLGVDELGLLRVIDDSGEDYLYSPISPGPMSAPSPRGKWEIIEDPDGLLAQVIPK